MVTNEDDGGLGAEVSSRLDELFAEDDEQSPEAGEQGSSGIEGLQAEDVGGVDRSAATEAKMAEIRRDASPIDNLKALVSEIEWEITDDTMRGFLSEVALLKRKYANDPVLSTFLKLHEAIGKYIKAKKVNAHPDAIKLVASSFTVFERIAGTPGMPEAQKKKLLSIEVKAFKRFKAQLPDRKRPVRPVEDDVMPAIPVKLEGLESVDSLADYIVRKLKNVIVEELEKIRRDLKKGGH